MSAFGTLLRQLRKEQGWSLNVLAEKAGTQKGYLSGIENGKVNPPSPKLLKRFARLFDRDEKALLRLAWADKAPQMIRDEALQMMTHADLDEVESPSMMSVQLLNPDGSPYPAEISPEGELRSPGSHRLVLPRGAVVPDAAVTVTDDSMFREDRPGYAKGDVVLLTRVREVPGSAICLLVLGGPGGDRSTIRHVSRDARNVLVLQPFNEDYPLEFVDPEEIRAVYRVSGRIELYEQELRSA
jgi:transcriptional regulator with XRE-family HTH domain